MFEFNRRILSRKAPIDGHMPLVAPSGPGSDLLLSLLKGGQPLRQALAVQSGEFNLRHIQPTPVFGGVMDLKALAEPACLSNGKNFIERSKRVRIEIVQHQHNLVSSRIGLLSQPT